MGIIVLKSNRGWVSIRDTYDNKQVELTPPQAIQVRDALIEAYPLEPKQAPDDLAHKLDEAREEIARLRAKVKRLKRALKGALK